MPDPNLRVNRNPDVVNVDEVVERLIDLGMDPAIISQATGAGSDRVQAVITHHRPNYTPEEKELAEDFRKLQHIAIKKAFGIIEFGPTEQKLAIIKTVLSSAGRAAAAEPGGGHDEIKVSFDGLMEEMRNVDGADTIEVSSTETKPSLPPPDAPPPSPPILFPAPEAAKNAPTTQATPTPTHDQDEVTGDEEVRFGLYSPR